MSKRAEERAVKIHNRAILEGEKYAKSHGGSLFEEVSYGRGFKAGYLEGYEQAEKETIERAVEWMKSNLFLGWNWHEKLNAFRKAMEEEQ